MSEIHGNCDERFVRLSTGLSEQLDSGEELGASIAVTIDGAPVVDIWGGWADEAKSRLGSATPSSTSGRRPRP